MNYKIYYIFIHLLLCLFVCNQNVFAQNNISRIEYSVDSLPEYGQSTSIPFTLGNDVIANFNLPLTNLNEGFHTLYLRAKDQNSNWSICQSMQFYRLQLQTNNKQISYLEYFVDTITNYGSGVSIPITPNDSISSNFNLPLSNLSGGFHNLFLIAKDINGNWSICQNIPFYRLQFNTNSIDTNKQISYLEYFIDTLTDYGSGVSVPITPNNSISANFNLPLTNLSEGFHILYLRAKDQNGNWSICQSMPFYRLQLQTNNKQISYLEYFVDTITNYGSGISIPITPNDSITSNFNLPLSNLSGGFHNLFLRAKDMNGNWSICQNIQFYRLQFNTNSIDTNKQISYLEYFIDTLTDYGSGVSVPITPNDSISVNFNLPLVNLNEGFHTLYLRAKDLNGNWSPIQTTSFYTLLPKPINNITYLEYFLDTVPDYGNGIPVAITPGNDITAAYNLPLNIVSEGFHTLYLRAKDQSGRWSVLESKVIKQIGKPKFESITPNFGGNIGEVTVTLSGAFSNGSSFKLTKAGSPDILVPDSAITYLEYNSKITATINLSNKTIGYWNVVVNSPDTIMYLNNAFKIDSGITEKPWCEVIGFNIIRTGQWQNYTIKYGNNGNIDANGTILMVAIPKRAELELVDELFKPDAPISYTDSNNISHIISYDSIPIYYILDTLFGDTSGFKIYPFVISKIAANSENLFTFRIKVNSGMPLNIQSWIASSLYSNVISSKPITNSDEFENCMVDAVVFVTGFVPLVGCITNAVDRIAYRPPSNWNVSSGMYVAANVAFGCVPFVHSLASGISNTCKFLLWAGKKLSKDAINDDNHFVYHGPNVAAGKMSSNKDVAVCGYTFNPKDFPFSDFKISVINSHDPNDKTGPSTYSSKNYLGDNKNVSYLIRFENDSTASAAAQEVIVIDTLDKTVFDLSTFQLGFITIGDRIINIPQNTRNYSTYYDLRPYGNSLILDIKATLNDTSGIAKWEFKSLDPVTMQPTTNPIAGFLPPNITAPEGEGALFYTIKIKDSLALGTIVKNNAHIYFDQNLPIVTPTWKNQIDNVKPNSVIDSLPNFVMNDTIQLHLHGSDIGSGISSFYVLVSIDDSNYYLCRNTKDTTLIFIGGVDTAYSFYSIAIDSAGNIENSPLTYDAKTSICGMPLKASIPIGIDTVCANTTCIYSSVSTYANKYNWKIYPINAGYTQDSSSNAIIHWNKNYSGIAKIYVKGINQCYTGEYSDTLYVYIKPLPDSALQITGPLFVCQGQMNINYTVPQIANAVNYIWRLPDGTIDTTISNTKSLNFITFYQSGNIIVKGNNNCGNSDSSSLFITVNPLPSFADTILGSINVCQGQNNVIYNVPTIANASAYIWTLFNGNTDTTTINQKSISFGLNALSGNISVKGHNNCGDGDSISEFINVNPLPDNIDTISGYDTVCQGQSNVIFKVVPVANALSYIWTLPNGTNGTSSTNLITANFTNNAQSGNIIIKGHNNCGNGDSISKYITVKPTPLTPIITKNADTISSNTIIGNQWYNLATGIIFNETAQTYMPQQIGDYFVIVTFNGCSSDSSNVIHYDNTGIVDNQSNPMDIKVMPNPFTDKTSIIYTIKESKHIKIVISDITGSEIRVFCDEKQQKGEYNLIFDAENLANGIYFYKLNADKEVFTGKIILTK